MIAPTAPREPLFNVPSVVLIVAAVLVVIHGARQVLPADIDVRVLTDWAFVPGRLTFALHPSEVVGRIAAWSTSADMTTQQNAEFARVFISRRTPVVLTLASYALLHGSWLHVGLNVVWLLAFGTPVARRFGALRLLLLLLVGSIAGALVHWLCFRLGFEPVIGASAAVSACMGAAVRFAFRGEEGRAAAQGPALSLRGVLRDRRALGFVVAWFIGNTLFGAGSIGSGLSDAPVAWQAHIGGFLLGLLLFAWFDRKPVAPTSGGDPLAAEPDQPQQPTTAP